MGGVKRGNMHLLRRKRVELMRELALSSRFREYGRAVQVRADHGHVEPVRACHDHALMPARDAPSHQLWIRATPRMR